ncbi:ABC transporter permease [Burkholderia pseudomultivorans]|uniref:ABC transporter permease n=1 Tax=Burkholderia pseudomultivorans TaxID=1207504 RepID=UPI0028766764|nr:ABC transporter permease [Burkholderia pseudomultivorans]MDS0860101.1 ABC transporter permease [Burkholderia pseudomultivorans]
MDINSIKKNRLFLGMVVLPMVLAIVYYGFLARNRYVSTSQVVVHKVGSSDDAAASQISGLAVLMGGGALSSSAETLYVREFVVSQDMLDILQKKLQWSQHYSGHTRDMWYYLSPNASREELLKYYQRMVRAQYDETTGLLTVTVDAFDRDFAKQTLATIISESDRFVNEISHRLAREQVGFAESEVARSRVAFEEKRQALLKFQGANNALDARQTAKARNEIITGLQADLAKEDTVLRALRANFSEDSSRVRQQKIRIQAIQQQISAEQAKLIAKDSQSEMNVVASKYQALEIDAGIAEDAYKGAVASMNAARIEAAKKLRSLVVVVSPNMPEESLFPRRLYSLFTVLVVVLLVYGITCFVIATIKDHQD